jgi:hypothetical protein
MIESFDGFNDAVYIDGEVNWKLTINEFLDIEYMKTQYEEKKSMQENYKPEMASVTTVDYLFITQLNKLIKTHGEIMEDSNEFVPLNFKCIIDRFFDYLLDTFEGKVLTHEIILFQNAFTELLEKNRIENADYIIYLYSYLYDINFSYTDEFVKEAFDSFVAFNGLPENLIIQYGNPLFKNRELKYRGKIIEILVKCYLTTFRSKKRACQLLTSKYWEDDEELIKHFTKQEQKKIRMELKLGDEEDNGYY